MTRKAFVRTTGPSSSTRLSANTVCTREIASLSPAVPDVRSSIGQGRFGAILQLQPLPWDDPPALYTIHIYVSLPFGTLHMLAFQRGTHVTMLKSWVRVDMFMTDAVVVRSLSYFTFRNPNQNSC